MRDKNNLPVKFSAVLIVLVLMMVNIQFEKPPRSSLDNMSVSFTVNEANANMEEGLEMREETCWNTGESIQICRYADAECSISG